MGRRLVHETSMLLLFGDQWRVHLQHAMNTTFSCVLHRRKAPQRIALVDEVETSRATQRRPKPRVGSDRRLLASSNVTFRKRRQPMQSHPPQVAGRLAVESCREHLHFGASLEKSAQHLLHMNRAALRSEDG